MAVDYLGKHSAVTAGQSLQSQVKFLIETVWGIGNATDALVSVGVEFMQQGGQWSDALLYLIRDSKASASITDAAGNLSVTQAFITRDLGFMPEAGNNVLRGNAGNDRLVGGSGNNTLDGGDGVDVMVIPGAATDFTLSPLWVNGQMQFTMSNRFSGAVNTLIDVEVIAIGGQYYDIGWTIIPAAGIEMVGLTALSEAELQLMGVSLL